MAILVVVSLFVPLAALLGFVTPPTAHAATSSTLNFQGRLLSNTGSLVADGTYNMQFNLYTVSSGGTTQWTESYLVNASQGVTIKSGYFSVNLGSITSFPSTINWDQEQWLGMTVRGTNSCTPFSSCATPADAEMTPRFKLTAVPYAFVAGSAQAVATNNTNAASTNSNNVTITSGNAAGATSNSGNVSIQVGTATQTRGQINIGTTNAPSSLTVGNTGTQFTLQGSAASTITATNGASTTTFGFVTPTANQTYNLPNSSAGTYTICTTANNCTGLSGYLVQVPTGNTANTPSNNVISPTAASVSGLTVNGTSNATGAVALSVVQTRAFAGLSVSQSAASDGISVTSSSTGNGQTISLTSTSGTQTAGLAITRNGAGGTTTSLLSLTNSAGTVTNAINISGTYTNYINAPSFKVAPSGFLGNMIITAGPGTDNISFTTLGVNINSVNNITLDATGSSLTDIKGANLYLNANSNFATNINNGTSTGSVGIGNTASGAVTLQSGSTISITSGTTNAVTLDSGTTGAVNIGTNANAKTITVGNSTGATQLVLNTGTAGANIASNGIANTVQIGNTTGAVAQTINIGTNATASSTNNVTIGSTVAGTTTVQNAATINLNAGTIVGNATTQAIFNTTATTINFAGAATALTVGATTGTTTIRNLVVVQGASVSIGATALQGSLILNDGNGGQTATIQTGNIAANTVLTLPAALGVTDTFCFVTLNNCTGSGVTTVGALDGNTYSANGASIAASTLYLQAATSTHVGLVTIGAQTFGGDKTFNNLVYVNDDLNVGTNTLLVDVSLGRVGIGTPTPTAKLEIDGSYSRTAWGTNGALLEVNNGITVTDTSSTGTVAAAVGSSFARPTFAASSATTYTDVATLYIAGSPIAGTNAAFTNQYSLWIDGGIARFDATAFISSGGVTAMQLSPANNTAITPDIDFASSGLLAFQTDAYINIDSDNSGTVDQFRILNNATTSSGNVLFGVDELAVTTLGNTGQAGTLKIYDGTSNTVGLTASGIGTNYTLTLPTSAGNANECLRNSGTAGTLIFGSCAGVSSLTDNIADSYDLQEGTNNYININTTNGSENISLGNATTNPSFSLLGTGNLTVGGNILSANSATGTTRTTEATARTNVTTVTITAAGFTNNDIIFINNAGQDYYTRVTAGGGTTSLTVSPAVSYDASATVTLYQNVRNIGATNSDYTTQTNRFFQGYFLGGVVTGAGSTTLSDGNLDSTGTLNLQRSGNLTSLGGNMQFDGTAARTITGPSTGGLTMTVASGPLSISTTSSGTLSVSSAGLLNLSGTTVNVTSPSAGAQSSPLQVNGLPVYGSSSSIIPNGDMEAWDSGNTKPMGYQVFWNSGAPTIARSATHYGTGSYSAQVTFVAASNGFQRFENIESIDVTPGEYIEVMAYAQYTGTAGATVPSISLDLLTNDHLNEAEWFQTGVVGTSITSCNLTAASTWFQCRGRVQVPAGDFRARVVATLNQGNAAGAIVAYLDKFQVDRKSVANSDGNIGVGTSTPAQSLVLNKASGDNVVELQTNGTVRGYMGVSNTAGNIINGSAVGDLMFRTQGGKLLFSTNSGSTAALSIDSSSNSTFAGTLSVNGGAQTITGTGTLHLCSNNWNGTGCTTNNAHSYVVDDTGSYNALMLIGNNASGTRTVKVWDLLAVQGNLTVTGTTQLGSNGTAFAALRKCTYNWNPGSIANNAETQINITLGTSGGCSTADPDGIIIGVGLPRFGNTVTYTTGTCNAGLGCQFAWSGDSTLWTQDVITTHSFSGAAAFGPVIRLKLNNASGANLDIASAPFTVWYIVE